MNPWEICLPETLRVGRIAGDGARDGRASHLVLGRAWDQDLFTRAVGDTLCGRHHTGPGLAVYSLAAVTAADCCPRCLRFAVNHGLLPEGAVSRALKAFDALRVVIPEVTAQEEAPRLHPWAFLPFWKDLAQGAAVPHNKSIPAMVIQACRRGVTPLPVTEPFSRDWFVQQAAAVNPGMLHVTPLLCRLPAPATEVRDGRIQVLAGENGGWPISGWAIARLAGDLVVSLSRMEILSRWYCPVHFPGGEQHYRRDFRRWHQLPANDAARRERHTWRREFTLRVRTAGYTTAAIAAWFFETESYIASLLTAAGTSPVPGA